MGWLEELKELWCMIKVMAKSHGDKTAIKLVVWNDKTGEESANINMRTNTLDRLITIVEEAEWSGILCDDDPIPMCPFCHQEKGDPHKVDCYYHEGWKP